MTSSIFGIKADLRKSKGSYLFDAATGRSVLDLFGMYASLPLGYNHPAFESDEFKDEVLAHAGVKLPLCEVSCEAAEKFYDAFTMHPSMRPFSRFHFCQTGALAIEAAVKAAMKATGKRRILTARDGFHGINGYGGFLAASDGPAAARLAGLPHNVLGVPVSRLNADAVRFYAHTKEGLAGVLVEPIMCTAGDVTFGRDVLRSIREACDETATPLIFDEVQTGFGGTGTMWHFERLGFVPDVVAFGKKAQVSGIMANEKMDAIFEAPMALAVTWNGDVIDMIRCRHIMAAYDRFDVLTNVRARELQFAEDVPGLRHAGLLMALDFLTRAERDAFVRRLLTEEDIIVIPTGERTIRMRPHLATSFFDADAAIYGIERARSKVAA